MILVRLRDLAYRAPGGDSGGVGFALGFTGLSVDSNTYSNFFATVLFGLGPGELAIGRPRLALDLLFDAPLIGRSEFLNIISPPLGPDFVSRLAVLPGNTNLYGATYSADYGATEVAATVVREFDAEFTVVQLAFAHEAMGTRFYGGAEWLTGGGDNIYGAGLGAETAIDRFTLGASGFMRRISGQTGHRLHVYGDYAVTPQFTIGAEAARITPGGGPGENLIGARAGYEFIPGLEANLSMLRQIGSPGTAYVASLGYRW